MSSYLPDGGILRLRPLRKVENLAKDVELQKMEKKWDELYEQTIEKNPGKMYDPIVGIDVLDNWDEITSVVNR